MKTFRLVLVIGVLWVGVAQAELMDEIKISGIIHNIDKEVVVIKTPTGKLNIPRRHFEENKIPLKPNLEVTVATRLSSVVRYNSRVPASKRK